MKLVMFEVQHRRRIRGNRTGNGFAAGDDSRIKGDDREDDEKMEVLTENHDREGGDEVWDPGWDWLKGKTVVLYGDSVLRYNMDHFCKVSRGWHDRLPPFFPGRFQTRSYPIVMPCPHIHIRVERLSNGADCSS
jgi:hypothetical protein